MDVTNAEMRGRLMVVELLVPLALGHMATLAPDPGHFIRAFMANAEDMIERAIESATESDQEAADHARAAFGELSDAMEQHLAQRARPLAKG
jgi:hypothetical protein